MQRNLFIRSKFNPILKPDHEHDWESLKLYNPGVIYHDGKYHLFYRAVNKGRNWQSVIAYAVSEDGENFQRSDKPLLVGDGEEEKRGLEDPRITKIDDDFYMMYTAYDGKTPRLSVATSKDLKKWYKRNKVFSDWGFARAGGTYRIFTEKGFEIKRMPREWSKSGGMFPEMINGKYLMLFGEYHIWFAESDDGVYWQGDSRPFWSGRTGDYFDNTFVEMGPPPIKTDKGWLVLYHGVNHQNHYQLGMFLLDLYNPRKVLYRSEKPIFSPEKDYETYGMVDVLPLRIDKQEKMTDKERNKYLQEVAQKNLMPHVIFCCGAVVVDGKLRIYYGASDSVICTAVCDLDELLSTLSS